jgi:hypothetical protein
MAAPQDPDSDPDSIDPQAGDPEDTSVDDLMEQAEALARELGAEVGLPEQPGNVKTPGSSGPRKPLPGIMAQMGRAEHAASQVAEELGSEQGRVGDAVDETVTPEGPPSPTPAPVPPEPKVRGAGVLGSDEGKRADAAAAVALADGDDSRPETADGPQGADGTKVATRSVPARTRVGSLALKCLEARHELLAAAARPIWRMSDVGRGWLERSQPALRALYALLRVLDKPFAWVPRSARVSLGHVALATLVMALVAFIVGWLR